MTTIKNIDNSRAVMCTHLTTSFQVKVLGTLALIDDGETDWKVLCIDVTDPLAKSLNDISDVEKLMPGRRGEEVNGKIVRLRC